jgi:hypothetical protein
LTPQSAPSLPTHISESDPPMGFALQSFAPPVQPYAVSDAVALLSLERLSKPPSETGRRCFAEAPRRPSGPFQRPSRRPSPSGLCSTRESATCCRRFRPTTARSSPGFRPLQGALPRHKGTTFTVPPLMRLSVRATNRPSGSPYRVSLRDEVGLPLSRLPTLLGFPTL